MTSTPTARTCDGCEQELNELVDLIPMQYLGTLAQDFFSAGSNETESTMLSLLTRAWTIYHDYPRLRRVTEYEFIVHLLRMRAHLHGGVQRYRPELQSLIRLASSSAHPNASNSEGQSTVHGLQGKSLVELESLIQELRRYASVSQ